LARQILKNALILSSTQVVSRILSFTFFLIIARYFGSDYFGKYYYVYTLIFLLTFISDSGLSALIVREIAKAKQQAGHILIHTVIIRIFISTLVYILLVTSIYFQPDIDIDKKNIIYILGLYIFSKSLFEYSLNFFQGYEKQWIFGLLQLLNNIILVLAAIIFIYRQTYFITFSIIPVVATLLSAITGFYLVNKQISFNFTVSVNNLILLMKRTIPFGLTLFVSAASARMGIIMLSWLSTDTQVGYYGVASRLIEGMMIVPIIINKITYPLLSILRNDISKFQLTLETTTKILLLSSSAFVIIGTVYAEYIIIFLFTNIYTDSVVVLQILLWILFASFSNYIIGHALFSADKQMKVLRITGSILFVNILLHFILIPQYGVVGAAVTVLVATYSIFIGYILELRHDYKVDNILKNYFKITLLCIVLVSVGLISKGIIAEILILLLLIVLFLFCISKLKIISVNDLNSLRNYILQKDKALI